MSGIKARILSNHGAVGVLATALVACSPSVATDSGTGSSSSGGDACVVGQVACECTPGGGCDPGLQCIVGVCIPDDGESSVTDSTTADTSDAESSPPDTGTSLDPNTSSDGGSQDSSGAVESSSEGPVSPCGNGRLEDGETCDDGNTVTGDGCNADCLPGGQEIWTASVDGGLQLEDWGHRVVTDDDDDVYVAGLTTGFGQNERNGIVVKFDDDGQEQWTDVYDSGETNSIDFFWGVAVTPAQDVVVTGTSRSVEGPQVPMVRLYDADGNIQWTYFEPDDGDAYANDVVVDSLGDIIVTGLVHDPDTFAARAWLAKFADDGNPIWNLQIPLPTGGGNVVLARDDSDALLLAGAYGIAYIIKLDADGDELWTWSELLAGNSSLQGAATGSGDDVFVTGTYLDNPISTYLARHPSAGGDPTWSDGWLGNLGGAAVATAITCDSAGRVIQAGYHAGNNQQGIFVRKYDADGEEIWLHQIDGLANGFDYAQGVTVDSQDNVVVSGRRLGDNGNYDVFVRKLTP